MRLVVCLLALCLCLGCAAEKQPKAQAPGCKCMHDCQCVDCSCKPGAKCSVGCKCGLPVVIQGCDCQEKGCDCGCRKMRTVLCPSGKAERAGRQDHVDRCVCCPKAAAGDSASQVSEKERCVAEAKRVLTAGARVVVKAVGSKHKGEAGTITRVEHVLPAVERWNVKLDSGAEIAGWMWDFEIVKSE